MKVPGLTTATFALTAMAALGAARGVFADAAHDKAYAQVQKHNEAMRRALQDQQAEFKAQQAALTNEAAAATVPFTYEQQPGEVNTNAQRAQAEYDRLMVEHNAAREESMRKLQEEMERASRLQAESQTRFEQQMEEHRKMVEDRQREQRENEKAMRRAQREARKKGPQIVTSAMRARALEQFKTRSPTPHDTELFDIILGEHGVFDSDEFPAGPYKYTEVGEYPIAGSLLFIKVQVGDGRWFQVRALVPTHHKAFFDDLKNEAARERFMSECDMNALVTFQEIDADQEIFMST